MAFSEHIKKALKKAIVSPLFLIFGALVVFSLGTLFGLGYLRYYVDGQSINRRAIHSTLVFNLWEEPQFVPGELNLLKGNMEATISEDGNTMIISRMFSRDNSDLFLSERSEEGWSKPVALSGFINTGYDERGPHLSRDGKWLLFQSNRPDTRGGYDLYIAQRIGDRWTEPTNLGDDINSKYDEAFGSFSPDGKEIFYSSNRLKPGEVPLPQKKATSDTEDEGNALDVVPGDWDLYQSKVIVPGRPDDEFLPIYGPGRFLETVNTESNELHVTMPASGRNIYFSSDNKDGQGGYDIWTSRSFDGEFIAAENIGTPVNSPKDELYPAFSSRGSKMVFVSNVYSIHPQALKYYESHSREVLSRFDHVLLRNVLLIILLLIIAGVAIHYLLKFLLDSELKLLPRCLIASFLLHLILAALTGSMFITSKIEESISQDLQEMTVNMNSLTQESIAVAIRESVASLPQVQAPTTLEQVIVEVPLKTESPVNNRVNPYPDAVSVQQTAVSSERFTQVRQAQATISKASTAAQVAKLTMTNSNMMMESPEGVIQSGDGDELDPNNKPVVEDPSPSRMESRRLVDSNMQSQPFEPIKSIKGEFEDTITEAVQAGSVGNASRSQLSGSLSNHMSKGLRESMNKEKQLDISSTSPTSVSFDNAYGSLIFKTNFVMDVVEEDEEEEEEILFIDFMSASTGRAGKLKSFGYDKRMKSSEIAANNGNFGELYYFDKFKKVKKRVKDGSLSGVSDLMKAKIPGLTMDVDSELEIPEYMLEDLDKSDVKPVF